MGTTEGRKEGSVMEGFEVRHVLKGGWECCCRNCGMGRRRRREMQVKMSRPCMTYERFHQPFKSLPPLRISQEANKNLSPRIGYTTQIKGTIQRAVRLSRAGLGLVFVLEGGVDRRGRWTRELGQCSFTSRNRRHTRGDKPVVVVVVVDSRTQPTRKSYIRPAGRYIVTVTD